MGRRRRKAYSKGFERDFQWYASVRRLFDFDGKYPVEVVFDPNGIDGKRAFHLYDSQGKLAPTRHPNLLQALIRTKGSVNLHVKMYAKGIREGMSSPTEVRIWLRTINAPAWVGEAIGRQARKLHDQ